MVDRSNSEQIFDFIVRILSAHLKNNTVPIADLPDFMRSVHGALEQAAGQGGVEKGRNPAVSPRRSITPDYIICLEDGRKLRMLKRHLKTAFDLTPEEYRKRWSLPADYPMVAPNYSRQRSGLARKIGLGKRRAT